MPHVSGRLAAATVVCFILSGDHGGARQSPAKKQVVAHRGASAYAPEHTLDAYRLAMEQKADYVEQDLAVTKDGVLVCIHDLTLERTTNVEDVFPTRFVENNAAAGPGRHWLVGDFTLAELKTLDAGSWFNPKFAGVRIPTFQEAIDLVGDRAGLYPELKDPAFYRARGVNPDVLLAAILRMNNLVAAKSMRVIIQSFDETTLQKLAVDLPQVPRAYLVGAENAQKIDSAEEVAAIAKWATGLAPNKAIIAARPDLVQWAHAAGLTVTPWTFRASNTGTFASVREEMEKFLNDYGVDAVFTDNPDQFPRK
ncbi:MAG: glycerophosphodiester phosphodiesterase family protein [Vicinamibacterales bacterium]